MSAIDDGDLAGVPLLEELSDSPQPQKKRKRSSAVDDEAKKAAKKARRKAKKPKDIDETELDTDLGINHAIGKMSSSLMADHIAQRTRRFRPELSLVEAEDGRIPGEPTLCETAETRSTDARKKEKRLRCAMLTHPASCRELHHRYHFLPRTAHHHKPTRLPRAILGASTEERIKPNPL